VDDALVARSYTGEVDLVLDITDETLRRNEGRWRLVADATGAEVSRTSSPADVALDTRALAAAYLGDDAPSRALVSGLLIEHSPGAATTLIHALRGTRAPHCPYMF